MYITLTDDGYYKSTLHKPKLSDIKRGDVIEVDDNLVLNDKCRFIDGTWIFPPNPIAVTPSGGTGISIISRNT